MKKNLKAKSNLKKKRRHGFLRRKLTRSGRAVLARRRKAGRKKIAL